MSTSSVAFHAIANLRVGASRRLDTSDGPATGFDDGSGNNSSLEGEIVTSQDTNEAMIALVAFWMICLLLFLAIFFISFQEGRRNRQTQQPQNNSTMDVEEASPENSKSNRTESQTTVQTSSRLAIFLTTVAVIIGFAYSVIPHTSCDYVDFTDANALGYLSVGLWSAEFEYRPDIRLGGDRQCHSTVNVDWFEVDKRMVAARVCAVIASVLGGISMLCLLYSTAIFKTIRGNLFRGLSIPLVLAVAFELATLVVLKAYPYQEDDATSSSLGFAFYSAATSAAYWFLAAIAVLVIPLASTAA